MYNNIEENDSFYHFRHNLHHFDKMFVHAREHIVANTFDVYKTHIIKQYRKYRERQELKNGLKTDLPEIDSQQIIKKIRVSNGEIPRVVNGGS